MGDEIGFYEAHVTAELDAGDDTAPSVVAQRRLFERQENGCLRDREKPRSRAGRLGPDGPFGERPVVRGIFPHIK